MTDTKHIVAVDLGSNSFHLVIAKEHQGRLTIVDRYKQRVSLSSGFDNNDTLSQEVYHTALFASSLPIVYAKRLIVMCFLKPH